MRQRYIQADIREDALLGGVVRPQHLKYVLPACFVGIFMMLFPFPIILRIILLCLIPGTTVIVLFLRIDQAIMRFRRYRQITTKIPYALIKDMITPELADVVIRYESGVRGLLLKVESISRELLGDQEYDRQVDLWGSVCGRIHEAGVVLIEITDWRILDQTPVLDRMEEKHCSRYKNDPEMLQRAMERIDYYKSLKLPQCQYHVLLLTTNPKVNLLALYDEMQQKAISSGLNMEILSAEYAYELARKQLMPFGERSSIDEEVPEDPKWIQLLKVWIAAYGDMKSGRDNRLIRKKKLKKEKVGENA